MPDNGAYDNPAPENSVTGDDERRAEIKAVAQRLTEAYGFTTAECAESVIVALDRVRRAPGPSSRDAETDAHHLVAERAIDAYLAAIPSSRERDAEIRAETITKVVAFLRTKGHEIWDLGASPAGLVERHFAAPPAPELDQ